MPKITVMDLLKTAQERQTVPSGEYRVKVASIQARPSNYGGQYFYAKLEIMEGSYKGKLISYLGSLVYLNGLYGKKFVDFIKATIGVDDNQSEFDLNDLIGMVCKVKVSEFEGNPIVESVFPANS